MRRWSIAVAVLTAALAGPALAQDPVGDWHGDIAFAEAPGGKVRAVIHIKKTADGYTVTGDSPDENLFDMPGYLQQSGPVLKLDFPGISGSYEGRWDAQRSAYVGQWTIRGTPLKLDLTKAAPKS